MREVSAEVIHARDENPGAGWPGGSAGQVGGGVGTTLAAPAFSEDMEGSQECPQLNTAASQLKDSRPLHLTSFGAF